MRTDRAKARANLRAVIEALPRHTRIAMLKGIERNEIIVGAYTNRDGVCPMLAAHRAGGRTPAIAFAKAWDRFALRGSGRKQPRRATERELLILKMYLQASLLATRDEARTRITPAPADVPSRGAAPAPARAGAQGATPAHVRVPVTASAADHYDHDRAPELAGRPGWSWSRLVRRYDDYERLMALLESELADVSEPALRP